jgi:hypothetical protein
MVMKMPAEMMMSFRIALTLTALVALHQVGTSKAVSVQARGDGTLPITAPIHRIARRLDLKTGRLLRTQPSIGIGGLAEVYDNTCPSGFYIGLAGAGTGPGNVTGVPFAEAFVDYGAIPATGFGGDASCEPGCADTYDITEFEIAWCQLAAPVTGTVIEFNLWNPPQTCLTGGPFGGMPTPVVTPVFATTMTGLPRSNQPGTLACYILTIALPTPGFSLVGSSSPGLTDKFAWSFSMPTTTGSDGPIIAGDINFSTPCTPCEGTIFEVGGQTTNQGTGAGQDGFFTEEDFGGTSATGPPCYLFGGANPPSGLHLELFAEKACGTGTSSFCDASDGSLASCPCAAGNPGSGCDTPIPPMAGGGLTGGIRLVAIRQSTVPNNRATLESTGFPPTSSPGGVLLRNDMIDPGSPVLFGDGLRCIDGTSVVRLGASLASGGTMINTIGHGGMAGTGTFYYQLWFRALPLSYCDPTAAFSLSNGATIEW